MKAEPLPPEAPPPDARPQAAAGAVPRRRDGEVAALVLTAVFAAATAPLWLDRALPVWDGFDYFFPAVGYLSDVLREGGFPMWDPFSGAGEPFYADPQKLVLNPVVLVLARLVDDPHLAFVLQWLVQWWWGAMGMLWLARRFGASAPGALLAGGAYALSGFFVSHAEHLTYVFIAGWLPWIVGLADGAVARRDARDALLAAAALAACAVMGPYPMLVAFTGLATAIWLVLRFVLLPDLEHRSRRGASARWVAGTLALMAGVTAVVWAPLLHAFVTEAAVVSTRLGAVAPETAIFGSPFTLQAAVSLVFPFATVWAMEHGVDLGADVSMTNAYMGFAVVPLAAVWLLVSRRERRGAWLLAFAAFMVLVSLGGVAGVRILLHYVFPPIRLMRFNAPFRIYWILAACLGAGLGLTAVARSDAARRAFLQLALAWCAVAAGVGVACWRWLEASGAPPAPALPTLLLPAVIAGPAVVGLAAWLVRRPAPAAAALVALAGCVDVAAGLRVNASTVWQEPPGFLARLEAAHVRSTAVAGDPRPRLADGIARSFNAQLFLKVPVLRAYTSFVHPDLGALASSRFAEVLCGGRRFWLAPGGEPTPAHDAALAALSAAGVGDPVPVFVQDGAGGTPRMVPGGYGEVAVERYAPEEVVLRADVPAAGGILASVERWTPGWKVSVDGRPAAALRTNLLFRGVALAPGPHRVVWTYAPDAWWPLVGLSAATLAVTLLAAGALALRARRQAGR